jgi:hypothetical protein
MIESYAELWQIEEKQSRMAPGGSIQEERERRKYNGTLCRQKMVEKVL